MSQSFILYALVLAALSGCARGSASGEGTGTADGNAQDSRLSDLAVAPATRRLYPSNEWIASRIRPSPDGRYVSMTDWSTGDLALHDLASDSTLRLSRKGSWNESSDWAETSVISPDGKSIAYGWYSDSRISYDIMVMSLSGADSGRTKSIYRAGPMTFTGVQAWMPDGKSIIAVIQDSATHVTVVPVSGGTSRRIKTIESGSPDNFSVSPDARWLAYDLPSDESTSDRDVFVLALDGRSESVVSNEKGNDFVVGWTRDGSRLLYGSQRGGTSGVWAASMTRGKPVGKPVLVRSDMLQMYPVGATGNGSILYGVNTGTRDVFLAPMDSATGELASRPIAMNGPSNVSPSALAWSPDGRHLAYVVTRGGMSSTGPSDIVIRSIDRGEARRLSPGMRRIRFIYWRDGSSLVVRGTDLKGTWGIYTVDLETAKIGTVAQSTWPGFGNHLSLSPDGRLGYFVNPDSAFSKFSVTELDLTTGAKRVVYTIDAPQFVNGMAVSPDGHQLGIGIRGGIYPQGMIALLPVAGGTPREIYRFGNSEAIPLTRSAIFGWGRSGKDLVFGVTQASDSSNVRVGIRALSISDGKLRSLRVPPGQLTTVRISPDGRQIAYFVNDVSVELWKMDEPVFQEIQ